MIYDPMLDELFAARRGGGATLNGAPIRASAIADLKTAARRGRLEHALAAPTRFSACWAGSSRAGAAVTRCGSGALALAYVAAGRRDGYVENHINAWDCLAGNRAGARSGRLRQRLPRRRRSAASGAPIVACAPGLKDALIATAAIRRARAMTRSGDRARRGRGAACDRAARRRGASPGASAASNCCGRAIRRSGAKSARSSIRWSAGRATAHGLAGRHYPLRFARLRLWRRLLR